MTIAASYVRESTAGQGDKYGPDAQRAAIARAAAEQRLELVTEYSDLISGTGALKRSDFQRMVTDARVGRFAVLVVYDTSRFARNEADAFTYEATLRAAGVRIYYAREGLWSDDKRSALHKGVMHVLNAQYSRDLSERIRDGYAAKFARHGLPGGTLPWGYRWTSAEARAVELVPDEAALRGEALTLYATGAYSAASLAEELNRRGSRVRGRPLNATTVYEVLRNPIAVGVARRKGEERTGAVPAIVDRGTWDACQRIMRERGHQLGSAARHEFIFTSRARHAACDRPLWGRMSYRPRRTERRIVHSRPSCGEAFQRSEVVIEQAFIAWLQTWSLDPRRRTRLAAFLREPTDDDGDREPRRRSAQARLERARRLYLLGDLDEATFERERREARAVLAATESAAAPTTREITRYMALADAWPLASVAARRALVESLTSEIRFGDDDVELVIRPEVRRMIAAVAAHEVRVAPLGQERVASGRFGGRSRGPGWIRTSDPPDVNRVL